MAVPAAGRARAAAAAVLLVISLARPARPARADGWSDPAAHPPRGTLELGVGLGYARDRFTRRATDPITMLTHDVALDGNAGELDVEARWWFGGRLALLLGSSLLVDDVDPAPQIASRPRGLELGNLVTGVRLAPSGRGWSFGAGLDLEWPTGTRKLAPGAQAFGLQLSVSLAHEWTPRWRGWIRGSARFVRDRCSGSLKYNPAARFGLELGAGHTRGRVALLPRVGLYRVDWGFKPATQVQAGGVVAYRLGGRWSGFGAASYAHDFGQGDLQDLQANMLRADEFSLSVGLMWSTAPEATPSLVTLPFPTPRRIERYTADACRAD